MIAHDGGFLRGLLLFNAMLVQAAALADELPDLTPVLGDRGELLFEADFNDADAKPLEPSAASDPRIVDGHLSLKQVKDAKHIGVVNLWAKDRPPVTDLIMQADFQWDGGHTFNVELKKPGPVKHGDPPEFFVLFRGTGEGNRPMSVSLADNAPRAAVAKQTTPIMPGQWCRFQIEVRDGEVAVQMHDGQVIRGKCNLASEPKGSPSLSFAGVDGKGVNVDNIHVWSFK
jgi:hypothetical protein